MKRLFIVVVLCTICLSLTACDPSPYRYDREELRNDVVGIELISYDNPQQKRFKSWVPNHYSKLRSFDLSNMKILETLDSEQFDGFITQLSDTTLLYRYYAFDSPNGICIRLLYSNGDFEVITCDYENNSFQGYAGRYNSSGEVLDFAGTFDDIVVFYRLVENYFETQLRPADKR